MRSPTPPQTKRVILCTYSVYSYVNTKSSFMSEGEVQSGREGCVGMSTGMGDGDKAFGFESNTGGNLEEGPHILSDTQTIQSHCLIIFTDVSSQWSVKRTWILP